MRLSVRLVKAHRWTLYTVWLLLSLTGLYFAYRQDWQLQEPDTFSINALKVHGIAAAMMLLLLGSLFSLHVPLAWQHRRNISSGVVILLAMLLLAMTGTGLYYSPERWHEQVKWLHIWIGLGGVVVLPLHIAIGRLLRSRSVPPSPEQ